MTIKIAGTTFEMYNKVSVNLIYDSVASKFSFSLYFDPNNASHRAALQPGKYPPVTITHNGELLITGTLLSYAFESSAVNHLVSISGYSRTGVFEDCQIPDSLYPLQSNGKSLTAICTKICNYFGIGLVVDDIVKNICGDPIPTINADITQTIASFLSEIAGQLNVVLSHTSKGELLLTKWKSKDASEPFMTIINNLPNEQKKEVIINEGKPSDRGSIANFTYGMQGVSFKISFDGQKMHSSITVSGQAPISGGNTTSGTPLKNPYVGTENTVALKDQNDINNAQIYGTVATIPRPKVMNSTTATNLTVDKAQRNALSDELKSIPLNITVHGWDLGGNIARAGDIVTVTNPYLHIYNKTRFFIQSVEYKGDNVDETCILNCVVPETFNNDTPKNIFV